MLNDPPQIICISSWPTGRASSPGVAKNSIQINARSQKTPPHARTDLVLHDRNLSENRCVEKLNAEPNLSNDFMQPGEIPYFRKTAARTCRTSQVVSANDEHVRGESAHCRFPSLHYVKRTWQEIQSEIPVGRTHKRLSTLIVYPQGGPCRSTRYRFRRESVGKRASRQATAPRG